jgi:hypothetical protein
VLSGAAIGAASAQTNPGQVGKKEFLLQNPRLRKLTGTEIRRLAVGNSIYGILHDGQQYAVHFFPQHECPVLLDDNRRGIGIWNLKDDLITAQFPTIANAETVSLECYRIQQLELYFCHDPRSHRFSWVFVTEGRDAAFDDLSGFARF